jgi:hypothetical protein
VGREGINFQEIWYPKKELKTNYILYYLPNYECCKRKSFSVECRRWRGP